MIEDQVHVAVTFFRPNLEEKEEYKRRLIFARTQSHIVYSGHIPHAQSIVQRIPAFELWNVYILS